MHDYFNWELKNGYIDMIGCWRQNVTNRWIRSPKFKNCHHLKQSIIDELIVSIKNGHRHPNILIKCCWQFLYDVNQFSPISVTNLSVTNLKPRRTCLTKYSVISVELPTDYYDHPRKIILLASRTSTWSSLILCSPCGILSILESRPVFRISLSGVSKHVFKVNHAI